MGFPVINVQSKTEDGTKTLTLTQEKFNADGHKTTGCLWSVPITILTANGECISFSGHAITMGISTAN